MKFPLGFCGFKIKRQQNLIIDKFLVIVLHDKKLSKHFSYSALICFLGAVVLFIRYTNPLTLLNYIEMGNYSEYFFNYRLPDFITQLSLIILSIIYFVKYLRGTNRESIVIYAFVWCIMGALASFFWSFTGYFQYPVPPLFTNFFVIYKLTSLLSTMVLFGTSIFFLLASSYTEGKKLSLKFVKKITLVDPKIDSDARKDLLGEISTANLKDNINSLTCVKCGSSAYLSFYTVIEKSHSRDKKRDTNYAGNSFDAPVCDPCSSLYDSWYSLHRKTKRHGLRAIGIIISIFVSFFGIVAVYILIYIIIAILPLLLLAGVIILIVLIIRRKKSFRAQNSPYKNIKIYYGNKVRVRPDNFKKWTSLQDWVLYSIKSKESGGRQLSEIETILLNYINENKGSAFSPKAVIKRALGENFNEEYVKEINSLLKKLNQEGLIDSNIHDGKTHYFSN